MLTFKNGTDHVSPAGDIATSYLLTPPPWGFLGVSWGHFLGYYVFGEVLQRGTRLMLRQRIENDP